MTSSKQKIAVIGASSMVGSRFCELQQKFELIKADLSKNIKVDITSTESIQNFFSSHEFDVAILFSAFTDVDGAETQRGNKEGPAWRVNVEGVRNFAQACQLKQKKLVFISTEFVFDGQKGPYSEESQRATDEKKISWYGVTKLKGEEIVEDELRSYIILRITYPYRSSPLNKDDFANSILKKYDSGKLHPMFNDQSLTPTFIDDVAPAIELLVGGEYSGVFHVASPETTTPYEFAKHLLKKFGKNADILKTASIKEYLREMNAAPRPINGGLKSDKISALGFKPTSWREGIEKMYEQTSGKLI